MKRWKPLESRGSYLIGRACNPQYADSSACLRVGYVPPLPKKEFPDFSSMFTVVSPRGSPTNDCTDGTKCSCKVDLI